MDQVSARCDLGPGWGAPWEAPSCRTCPTSRVLGSPLTSRQRTGISMLLVPVDGWSTVSTQVPG